MFRNLHIQTLAAVALLISVATLKATAGNAVYDDDIRPDRKLAKVVPHHAQPLGIRYTRQHPVVFVADRRMYPFSFYNDNAMPDGFSVELIRQIFSNLRIPYEIRLVSPGEVVRQLISGEAQLTICLGNPAPDRLITGGLTLTRQRLAVARLYSTQQKTMMEHFDKGDTILVPRGGYAYHTLETMYPDSLRRPFVQKIDALSSALQCIVNNECQYAIGSRPYLKHHVKRLALDDIVAVDDINLPEGRYHFISNDKRLVEEMERQFMRYRSDDSFNALKNRWLSDSGNYEEPVNVAYTIAIAILIVLALVIIFIVIASHRGKSIDELKTEFRTIARVAQEMSSIQILVGDMNTRWVSNVTGDISPPNGLSVGGFEAYIHPDDIAQVYQMRMNLDNGTDETEEPLKLRIRKYSDPQGKWRTVTVYASTKRHRNGTIDKIYLAVKDDTDLIIAKQRNRLQRSTVEQFGNLTEVSIVYFDNDGRCIYANKAFRQLLASGDLFASGASQDIQWFIDGMTLTDVCAHFGGVHVTPDEDLWFCSKLKVIELGLSCYVEVRITPLKTVTGGMEGYTLTMTNLNRRRQDMATLAMHRRRLERVEKERNRHLMHAQMMMRNNKVRMMRWDKGNDFVDLTDNLLTGQRFSALSFIKDVVSCTKAELQPYIDNPRKFFDNPYEVLHQYKWVEGGQSAYYQWIRIIPRPRRNDAGEVVGYEAILIDETEKQDTLHELERQQQAVKQLAEEKANFIANMTHELRTPLNIINGFAEVLPFTSDGAERKLYTDIMAHNTAMLMHISQNILHLSIADATGVSMRQSVVDFAAYFAANAHKMGKFISPQSSVKFQVDTPMEHLYMLVDPVRIFEILEIFVTNASKNTTSGRIRIGYRYHDNKLLIYCTDTGCGIPYGSREDLFRRFYKVNDFVLGVGLGLPLAKAIADALAGTIRYFSCPPKGTVFVLVLPRPLASAEDLGSTHPRA